MIVDIYVTHYVTEALGGYNDIAIDCVMNIDAASRGDGVAYRTVLLYWAETLRLEEDLLSRLPAYVVPQRCERHDQPHLMNEATRHARACGADLFLCVHNDIRPTRRWLRNIVNDVREAEKKHGRGNVVATPRYIPYHWIQPHAEAFKDASFWDRIRPEVESKVLSGDAMRAWCKRHGFDFEDGHVVSPRLSYTTDDGHQLMMYCARPCFFDEIGGCDESFTGLNYGDCDWGIRALRAGKKNLISQGCLLGHISGLTFFNPKIGKIDDNHQRFIAKWGQPTWKALQDGSIWRALHAAQDRSDR